MDRYYAVRYVNNVTGVSVRIEDAESKTSAVSEFNRIDGSYLDMWTREGVTEIEDDLGVTVSGADEESYFRAIADLGAKLVCNLDDHVTEGDGGWQLWMIPAGSTKDD